MKKLHSIFMKPVYYSIHARSQLTSPQEKQVLRTYCVG